MDAIRNELIGDEKDLKTTVFNARDI